MEMHRYFLELQFDGGPFHGWQRQPNAPTVQETLESALATLLRRETLTTGAGRTDTGVHALQMFAHFDHPGPLPSDLDLVHSLNALLPSEIAVRGMYRPIPPTLDARFDAVARTYRYFLLREQSAFHSRYAKYLHYEPDLSAMRRAAALLLQYSDFASFCKLHGNNQTTRCRMEEARFFRRGSLLLFQVSADRFLRGMVRALVGTLLEVGRGRCSVDQFRAIIEARDRTAAAQSIDPQGLYLYRVRYPPGSLERL